MIGSKESGQDSLLENLRSHFDSSLSLNVILRSPIAKICYIFDTDFGFAQYLHSEEETQTMRGSPLYMVKNLQDSVRIILFCTYMYSIKHNHSVLKKMLVVKTSVN